MWRYRMAKTPGGAGRLRLRARPEGARPKSGVSKVGAKPLDIGAVLMQGKLHAAHTSPTRRTVRDEGYRLGHDAKCGHGRGGRDAIPRALVRPAGQAE